MTDVCGHLPCPPQPWTQRSGMTTGGAGGGVLPAFCQLTGRKYSLCHVLILGAIISDVCGSCDPTDDERDPSADEVEPVRDQKDDFPGTAQIPSRSLVHRGWWLDFKARPPLRIDKHTSNGGICPLLIWISMAGTHGESSDSVGPHGAWAGSRTDMKRYSQYAHRAKTVMEGGE